ncbi:MAG: long-chain fatty acid--CoA ligase, partial [Gammaproteobacteria bacterium]
MTARTPPFPASGNLGDLIRPDVPRESLAVIDVSASGRRWSCAKLNAAAEGFAASLVRAPLATDARVAILAENCAEYLIAYLGTMRAGCVSVPVNHRHADTARA